jgi:hypothetical protein
MDRTKPDAPDGAVRHDDAALDVPAPPAREPDPAPRESDSRVVVIVTVTRSGGITGIPRRWRAQAGEDEASPWIARIEGCPWDAVTRDRMSRGADRFMWAVDARCGQDERQAELADADVRGPWRELIDAVREEGSPLPRDGD